MSIPKVFISYSHDSASHKTWVLDIATRLRGAGIDAVLDQWELRAGDDLPSFMERNLDGADYVLMICTTTYVEKANAGRGGVGYEKMIVTSDLMKDIDSNKVIPIIRQEGSHNLPTFLKTKLYIDMSSKLQTEFGFDELVRTIQGAPLYHKPEIGTNPYQHESSPTPKKRNDGIEGLMKIVADSYNKTDQPYIKYSNLLSEAHISRIMLEFLMDQAIKG